MICAKHMFSSSWIVLVLSKIVVLYDVSVADLLAMKLFQSFLIVRMSSGDAPKETVSVSN